jgi:hypothetical protein
VLTEASPSPARAGTRFGYTRYRRGVLAGLEELDAAALAIVGPDAIG